MSHEDNKLKPGECATYTNEAGETAIMVVNPDGKYGTGICVSGQWCTMICIKDAHLWKKLPAKEALKLILECRTV
jgi:hypothetical protein